MDSRKLFWFGSIVLPLLLISAGCQQEDTAEYPPEDSNSFNAPPLDESFLVGPGDIVLIKFFYESRLNDEVVVRPDGKVSLQLVGELTAAGLTPQQLESRLAAAYAKVMYPETDEVSSYALAIGSIISVKFLRNSELNDDLIIRPDGMISIPLIGQVRAAGLTPNELENVLSQRHAQVFAGEPQANSAQQEVTVVVRDFKMPELTVSITGSATRRVYVTGEVRSPGFVSLSNGMVRVLDAVILSGGTLDTAERGSVVLLRSRGNETPYVYTFNLQQIASGEAPNFMLKPYDVVYVPKTLIANVATFVQQHIQSIVPFQFNLFYNVNPSEVKVTD